MLAIGAALLGSAHVVGVDIDAGALDTAEANVDAFEDLQASWGTSVAPSNRCMSGRSARRTLARLHLTSLCQVGWGNAGANVLLVTLHLQVDLVQCAVASCSALPRLHADTVIMNPPFGTRRKGADLDFLRAAFHVCAALQLGTLQHGQLLMHLDFAKVGNTGTTY